ncbi:MAG: hypothetical protein NVS2B9_06780 [Myxococcales bacterium]
MRIASASPLVRAAFRATGERARRIAEPELRTATLDALFNEATCIRHRAGLNDAAKARIIGKLVSEGLLNPADGAAFPGGAQAGVFPPVRDDGSACPRLPQPFLSAPGSSFGGHHSYPGGLPLHEDFNGRNALQLAEGYASVYGGTDGDDEEATSSARVSQDILLAAPLWHDWAKTIVFQWNEDGSEFKELNFGGAGSADDAGAAGDSRTGGHHILGVAEAMKRGLSPDFVLTQASAHAAPTLGNEYKVVNWIRAAAIIAGIDPVRTGFLRRDSAGKLRLPALRQLGSIDLNAAAPTQTNLLPEYAIHNLSDADYIYSGPVVATAQLLLSKVAPRFGYDPADAARYNVGFRNVVLSRLSAERIQALYAERGIEGLSAEVEQLRRAGAL